MIIKRILIALMVAGSILALAGGVSAIDVKPNMGLDFGFDTGKETGVLKWDSFELAPSDVQPMINSSEEKNIEFIFIRASPRSRASCPPEF